MIFERIEQKLVEEMAWNWSDGTVTHIIEFDLENLIEFDLENLINLWLCLVDLSSGIPLLSRNWKLVKYYYGVPPKNTVSQEIGSWWDTTIWFDMILFFYPRYSIIWNETIIDRVGESFFHGGWPMENPHVMCNVHYNDLWNESIVSYFHTSIPVCLKVFSM